MYCLLRSSQQLIYNLIAKGRILLSDMRYSPKYQIELEKTIRSAFDNRIPLRHFYFDEVI